MDKKQLLENLKKLSFEKYSVIFINYEIKNGIEIRDSLEDLTNSLDDFYKMYIFNNDFMISIVYLDEDEYFYEKVEKTDFQNSSEELLFIDYKEISKISGNNHYSKLRIRRGFTDEKANIEKIQYIGLEV